jgi:hypothetical protein
MKSKLLTASILATAMMAGFGAAPALAQYVVVQPQVQAQVQGSVNTPQIDQAQYQISARIQEGMANGRITPSEAQVLLRRERELQAREAQFKANGNVNPQERQQLRAEVASLNADVERMMANADVVARPGQPGYGYGYGNPNTNGIDNQERQISLRIDEGLRTGQITQREAERLHMRERRIERHEAQFKSDGVVTQDERRQLRSELSALRDEVERLIRSRRARG